MTNIKQVARYCLLVLLLGTISITSLQAQEEENKTENAKTPKNIPPSPNAAALEKFADVPVSLYTGIPGISVPIHTLKSRSLSVPVSLSYHYTGFKPNETPSWVGLGWALNAGGVITCSPKGKSDFNPNGGYWKLTNPIKGKDGYDPYGDPADWTFLSAVADGYVKDTQPDVYSFNVGGASGKFFLKKLADGTFKAYTIPYQDIKIEVSNTTEREWEITLPNGTKYFFGGAGFYESTDVLNESSPDFYTSAWYLKKIVSANGDDEINFVYQKATNDIGYKVQETESRTYSTSVSSADCAALNSTSISTTTIMVRGRLHIKEIVAKTGHKIVFHEAAEQRWDYNDKALDKVEVIAKDGTVIKRHQLSYAYMGEQSPYASTNKNYLLLAGVQEVSGQVVGLKKGAYTFSYNQVGLGNIPVSTHSPGSKTPDTKAIDHWGYYNGAANSTLIPSYRHVDNSVTYEGANRDVNPEKTKVGAMIQMNYPTGGKATFDWESNIYNYSDCDGSLETVTTRESVSAGFGVNHTVAQSEKKIIVLDSKQTVTLTVNINTQDITSHETRVNILRPYLGDTSRNDVIFSRAATSTTSLPLNLDAGTYIIEAQAWAPPVNLGNSTVSAHLSIEYTKQVVVGVEGCNKPGPGLRIAKVTMSDGLDQGNNLIKKYRYRQFANPNVSSGFLPGGEPVYSKNGERTIQTSGDSRITTTCNIVSLSSSSVSPTGYTKGSPIGYANVTVLHGEAGSNGRTEHEYSDVPDKGSIDNDWQRGHLIKQRTYDVHGRILQATHNYHSTINGKGAINNERAYGITAYWSKNSSVSDAANPDVNKIIVNTITLISAWHRLDKTENFQYFYDKGDLTGTSQKVMKTVNNNFYEGHIDIETNTQHAFPTRTETTNSEGQTITTKNFYAQDVIANLPSGNKIIATGRLLKDKYMIGSPVLSLSLKDNKLMGASFTEFTQSGNRLLPSKTYVTELAEPLANEADAYSVDGSGKFVYLKPKESFTFENTYGNLVETQAEDNIPATFIWGYQENSLVTAHAVNAKAGEIAYSSFEAGSDWGNWGTVSTTWTTVSNEKHTGANSLYAATGNVNINNNTLPQKDYKVSFWKKGNGNVSVNSTNNLTPLKTLTSGWSLYETTISNTTSVSVVVPQGVYLDELRLHPVNAQMTTFTHQPLVGLSSKTGATHQTIYYVYDGLNRLKMVKDFEGNILKRYTYKYKGH